MVQIGRGASGDEINSAQFAKPNFQTFNSATKTDTLPSADHTQNPANEGSSKLDKECVFEGVMVAEWKVWSH